VALEGLKIWKKSDFGFLILTFKMNSTHDLLFSIAEDEEAFDVLYCIAFEMMDAQWLAMHAYYMEFNVHPLSLSLTHTHTHPHCNEILNI
jgi:hypothetical protein